MIKINYKQEHPTAAVYILPAILCAVAIVVVIYNLVKEGGYTALFIQNGLLPGASAFIVGIVILIITKRKAKKAANEIKEIRENGQMFDGTISEIITYEHISHDDNNHRTVEHSYKFLVHFGDKSMESIETFTKYELEGDKCRALLYNGKVLVDEAQVKELPRKLFSI